MEKKVYSSCYILTMEERMSLVLLEVLRKKDKLNRKTYLNTYQQYCKKLKGIRGMNGT